MPTQLIRSIYNLKQKHQGCVMTIGNFDGVHVGHQQLIAQVVNQAKSLQKPSLVMTFEPHPFEFFLGSQLTIPRITRLREKFCALSACGVDYVLILPFNQSVAEISASDFADRIIVRSLSPSCLIVGDDFHFGHKREGNFAYLQKVGKTHGFSVTAIDSIKIRGERVSSTWVRKALAQGDHELARQLLGRPYTMQGRIRRGDQRGREWGFPTANIYLHRKLTPLRGVYTVLMHGIEAKPIPGVANVGVRPTVDGTQTLLEVHLFDFHQDIYGRYVTVEFCKKLRDEIRYANFTLLKEQIAKDAAQARAYFQIQLKGV